MRVPLFPLDTVLFPSLQMPLHVFEARYREMIGRCISDGRPFGVARAVDGLVVGGDARCADVGTLAEIDRHRRLPDGRLLIVVTGTDRFRIDARPDLRAEADGDAVGFPQAEITFLEGDHGIGADLDAVAEMRRLAQRWVALAAEADEIESFGRIELDANPETASFQVSGSVVRDLDLRQELLQVQTPARIARLVDFLTAENVRLESAILNR